MRTVDRSIAGVIPLCRDAVGLWGCAVSTIYISGPMTGMPHLNFPAFHTAARQLRFLGHTVVNPAELNPDPGKSWHECMRADIVALMTCDGVALLTGWENSRGATIEQDLAARLGMEVHSLAYWLQQGAAS